VQGQDADRNIGKGIHYFNKFELVDVIVITRGGGSIEDLMCFNSESLAREIFGSKIPVITAIGHEIDWTIADFVSDLRLPTPTAVASFLSPLRKDFEEKIELLFNKILKNAFLFYRRIEYRIDSVANRIKHLIGYGLKSKFSILRDLSYRLAAFSRVKILRQGYALVRKNGNIITAETSLEPGDPLEIEILGREFSVVII
jgi:exodeoxyribonuclease VII large subunit